MMTAEARKQMVSKVFNKALQEMKKPGSLKYRLQSAHDTQVVNILTQLVPSYNFTYVPYASSVILEYFEIGGGVI